MKHLFEERRKKTCVIDSITLKFMSNELLIVSVQK